MPEVNTYNSWWANKERSIFKQVDHGKFIGTIDAYIDSEKVKTHDNLNGLGMISEVTLFADIILSRENESTPTPLRLNPVSHRAASMVGTGQSSK
jgi:hypothetical protein